jgi:hypothetical protein
VVAGGLIALLFAYDTNPELPTRQQVEDIARPRCEKFAQTRLSAIQGYFPKAHFVGDFHVEQLTPALYRTTGEIYNGSRVNELVICLTECSKNRCETRFM